MNPYEIDTSIYSRDETRVKVRETAMKIYTHFKDRSSILVSISGGSDSDCILHFICKYFPEYLDKCHFVFIDTGLEYEATKRHLRELEAKYRICIEKIRGRPIPAVVKQYGVPILSKTKAEIIEKFCARVPWAAKRVLCGYNAGRTRIARGMLALTPEQTALAWYCMENGVNISAKCCDESKKKPLKKYMRENGIDLNVTGERRAEGGQRALTHKTCFECGRRETDAAKYMPLWWWSDADKADFIQAEGIKRSDCYEIWGFTRTGCCGCPFTLDIADNLRAIRTYEPKLYRACMAVFGEAYRLTDKFHARSRRCLPDFEQQTAAADAERGRRS